MLKTYAIEGEEINMISVYILIVCVCLNLELI